MNTTPTPIPVQTTRDQYADDIIRQLEHALEIARTRPQKSMVLHMVGRDGNCDTFFSTLNVAEHAGLLAIAQHNLIAGARD